MEKFVKVPMDLTKLPSVVLNSYGYMSIRQDERPSYVVWKKCREQFHSDFDCHLCFDHFFYYSYCPDFLFEKMTNIFVQAEKKLGLVIPTVISRTNSRQIVHVLPSPFWRENRCRMQVMSLLCRSAPHDLPEREFMKSMGDYAYCADTMHALTRFFDGYTGTNSHFSGLMNRDIAKAWVWHFSKNPELAKYPRIDPDVALVKPEMSEGERMEKLKEISYHLWKNTGGEANECWGRIVKYHQEKNFFLMAHPSFQVQGFDPNQVAKTIQKLPCSPV